MGHKRISSKPLFPYLPLLADAVLGWVSCHIFFIGEWAAEWGFGISALFFLTVLTPCGNVITRLRNYQEACCMFSLRFPVQSVRTQPMFHGSPGAELVCVLL